MQLWPLKNRLKGKKFSSFQATFFISKTIRALRTDGQTNTNTGSVATLLKTEFCTCTYHINACPKLGVQFLRERDALSNCFSNLTDRQTDLSYRIAALLTRVWWFLRGKFAFKTRIKSGHCIGLFITLVPKVLGEFWLVGSLS